MAQKLSNIKKAEILKAVIWLLKTDRVFRGMCTHLATALGKHKLNPLDFDLEDDFGIKRPKENYGWHWYPLNEQGTKIRIEILENRIKQLTQ